MGVGDEVVGTANAIVAEIRERTEPQRARLVSLLMALNLGSCAQARSDVTGEIERAAPGKERMAEGDEKWPGVDLGPAYVPDTLKKQVAARSLTWASVTNEDLLRTIQTAVLDGMTSGSADVESMKDRLNSVFRGWVDDGTIDPTTGEKLTTAHKLEAIARTQASASYNAGRLDLLMDPETDVVEAMEYSAILDGRTSKICEWWDGKVIPKDAAHERMIRELNPPNHVHCRSFMVGITSYEPWTPSDLSNIPAYAQPQKGFGVIPTA